MIFTLQRETKDPTLPTIGTLSLDGKRLSDSVELPWKDNRTGQSCIPAGTFRLTFLYSPHFKRDLLHVLNVPGRDAIEIHPANYISELRGCLSLGTRSITDPGHLLNSQRAVSSLEAMVLLALDRKEIVMLEILDPKVAV